MTMRKIVSFPRHYRVTLDASGKLSAGSRPVIPGGLSEPFDGGQQSWAPEDLLVAAVGLDYVTTLQSLAAEAGLVLHGCRCTADGTLAKAGAGIAVEVVLLEVELKVASADRERARLLAQRTRQFCVVANALRCPVDIELVVNAGEIPASLESVSSVTPPGWPEPGKGA
ncbi:MAG: OsmC family protein [Myxococcales bacterium]